MKDKEETKRKLIEAVGEIIRTKGYTGLGVNKIARQAGVDKVLIYRYFNTVENLIETYVTEKDYWMVFSEKLRNQAAEDQGDLQEIISSILENQFEFFFNEKEMQQLIIWEISEKGALMKRIAHARESLASEFLELTDKYFENSGLNFRVMSALLSAGIYYMVLHADVGEYCGIDIRKTRDRLELKRSLRQMVSMIFEEKERKV